MEQGVVSMISPTTHAGNSTPKTKGTSIAMPTGSSLRSAKEKFKSKWIKELLQEDCSAWDTMKIAFAEFVGTGILVLMGCIGSVGSLGNEPKLLQSSLGFGLAVMIVIQSLGHISGAHINPAVTVGSVVLGKKSLRAAAVYLVAQCLGAIMGYGLLKVVTPQNLLYGTDGPETTANFCVTLIHKDISLIQGFLVEVIATAIMMLVNCGVWDVRNERNTDSVAIKFALAVTVLCLAFAPYTGCSMNPARSLGPAVWNNDWSDHWVFWFGPMAGSLLATIMYRSIFAVKEYDRDAGALSVNVAEIQKP